MAPKVPVVVRVELGKKHHQSGRMHEAEVALSIVVSEALERAEPEIAAGKLTVSTVKCFRSTEFSGSGTVLDNEDLGETTVWPRRRFLEFPFGNLGVWRGVEIGKFLEIWGSGEVWKLEIPEIRPSKCLISSPVEI